LTTPGMVLCTPGYVAPERLQGEPATPASDLYSVGVLLYEALSGRRPFVADTPLGVASRAQSEDPPPLDSLREGLDRRLVDLVHRALDRDPKERFESALDMRDELIKIHDDGDARTNDDPTVPVRRADPATASVPTGFAPAPARSLPSVGRGVSLTVLTWVVLALIGIIVAVALVAAGDDPTTTPESPTVTTTPIPAGLDPSSEEIPEPLADALEHLEEEVKP